MIDNKSLDEKYMLFSKNLRTFRKKQGLTQEQLAEVSDLSTSYIKQIEAGKEYKNVSLTSLLKISKALNANIEDLFISHSKG